MHDLYCLRSCQRRNLFIENVCDCHCPVEKYYRRPDFRNVVAELHGNLALTTEALNAVRESSPQFLYRSAETVLGKAFLAALKEDSALHRAVSAIVVDESHTECQIRNRFPFFSAQIYYYRFRLIMKRAERFNATTRVNNYHFSFGA